MGEINYKERIIMRINLGVAELVLALAAITMSIGGSWVVVKEQVAKLSEVSTDNKKDLTMLDFRTQEHKNDIVLLKERDSQLFKSTESYRESLDGLRVVLSELNTTLSRMDERMKNVEEGIKNLED